MELNLQGKNVLVVASSQGLGKEIARSFVLEQANVMISGRNEQKLIEVKNELALLNKGRVEYCVCDVTDAGSILHLVETALARFGGIDILINNSGGPKSGSFEEMTDEDWVQAFNLNLLSYVRTIREVVPHMKRSGGRIINIASSSIKSPIPNLILSNTFRVGIAGLSKSLANELAPHNILVNTIAPGRIETDRVIQLDNISAAKKNMSVEAVQRASKSSIPLNRYGTPKEFANAVIFLASEASSYITGTSILVDGGKTPVL